MNRDPFSIGQSLLRFAVTVLVAALALHWAAGLLIASWKVVAVALAVVLASATVFTIWRAWWHRSQW